MSQLFPDAQALENLPPQRRPRRGRPGNARERVLRLASIARLGAPPEIFSPTVKRSLLRLHTLSLSTHLKAKTGGQTRVLKTMAPGKDNHDANLVRASASQRRGLAALSDRLVDVWAVRSNSPLFGTFGETLVVQRNPRKASDGMRMVDTTCYVSARAGDHSVIQAHHVFEDRSRGGIDYLIAPLDGRANSLVSALVHVDADEDDFGFLLHLRLNNLALCCDWMDGVRGDRIEPLVSVEEKKKERE